MSAAQQAERAAQADLTRVVERARASLDDARTLLAADANWVTCGVTALIAIADQLALANALTLMEQARATGELPRLSTSRIP